MVLVDHKPWHRRHDDPNQPIVPAPPSRCYPDSREDLIDILNLALKDYDPTKPLPELRAAGSHWALSKAAIAHDFFVETQDPEKLPPHYSPPHLNRTLFNVIPSCLTPAATIALQTLRNEAGVFDPSQTTNDILFHLYHVEAGTRIYELYSRLDAVERGFALQTMGGAGGQTIVGALTTGTHGGDVLFPPIADCVKAIHLIAPSLVAIDRPGSPRAAVAAEYWLERDSDLPIVDETKLQAAYPKLPEEHEGIRVLRDDSLFDAVLVSAGRFGFIYSVVLVVGHQYCLRQIRRKSNWSQLKSWINNPSSPNFPTPVPPINLPPADPRFVQVVINPNVQPSSGEHTCWITFNHKVPVTMNPPGREERRGPAIANSNPQEFQNAGKAAPYPPNISSGPFSIVCSNSDPINNLISGLLSDAEKALAAAVLASLLDPSFVVVVAAATVIVVALEVIKSILPGGPLGNTVGAITNWCAANNAYWLLQEIAEFVIDSEQQTPWDKTAISYAILDSHDYTDIGCDVNVDSLEVFFDAADPQELLIKYVENIFQRINELEKGAPWANNTPQAFAGYVSLRFMAKSRGLIAMQRFERTCAMEIAGFTKVDGTAPFLQQIERDAVSMGGTVHWGQRNDLTMEMVEKAYGGGGGNSLASWRTALARFSAGGRLQCFSTEFTRERGLEVVQPAIKNFTVTPPVAPTGTLVTVEWESDQAPGPTLSGPGTTATLKISPSGQTIVLGAVDGTRTVPIPSGFSDFTLVLEYALNTHMFTAHSTVQVHGT